MIISRLCCVWLLLGGLMAQPLVAQPLKIQTQVPKSQTTAMASPPPPDGVYFLKIISTNKYAGVAGVDPNNGAVLIQWDYANQSNHKFELKNTGNNRFTLMAVHSNRYLNIAGQSMSDNAPVIQWDYVDQPNLYFSVLSSSDGRGYHIRCEQSGKFLHVEGGNENRNNGPAIVQFSGKGAVFYFEPANRDIIFTLPRDKMEVPQLYGVVQKQRKTSDGRTLTSTYNIYPSLTQTDGQGPKVYGKAKTSPPKPTPSDDTDCETSIVRISLDDNSFMTADVASQVEEIVPGSVFNILDYLSGSWKRQEASINPFVLSGSVKNLIAGGTVFQTVQDPRLHTLRQAIANLYGQFSTNANQQSSLSFQATVKEVNNQADFQLQIGAGAHYLTYSIDNLFSFDKSEKKSYLLIDMTKIMFTIDAEAPQGGFFMDETLNSDPNMVYIKKADYGMRVLASVETRESLESIANKLDLKVEALVAGADVSMDLLSSKLTQETTVKMFIVGGDSRAVVPAYSVADLKNKVENMARTLTYQTSQPIKYTIATTRDNHIVTYRTATDEFIRQTCTPPALKSEGARIEVGGLMIRGDTEANDDIVMYGKSWVMAYRADGTEIPAVRGENMLMDLPGEHAIDLSESQNQLSTANKVVFLYPPGTREGAYIDVYFALFERDANPDYAYGDGDDDHFTFRYTDNTKFCETGPLSRRLCYKRVYLDQMPAFLEESFGYDGDVVHLTKLNIFTTPTTP
ncbi:MAG: hypothetical protein EAZ89_01260 [Bacteroidetes bacterium]|nr:MAG: hypothetical protein EAZ89_01260 [Bacteroidota bacterium]